MCGAHCHFNENTETLGFIGDTCIRQVATLLGYGEPQILEVFQNTHSHKIILGTISHR